MTEHSQHKQIHPNTDNNSLREGRYHSRSTQFHLQTTPLHSWSHQTHSQISQIHSKSTQTYSKNDQHSSRFNIDPPDHPRTLHSQNFPLGVPRSAPRPVPLARLTTGAQNSTPTPRRSIPRPYRSARTNIRILGPPPSTPRRCKFKPRTTKSSCTRVSI